MALEGRLEMSAITRKRLSVAGYDKLIDHGILPETNRFELIRGRIVEKDVKGPEHRIATRQTLRAIERSLPPGWHANKEEAVSIPGSKSEPEPDISVVRGNIEDYADRNPGPGDVALVVEVTRSSAAKERRLARVYGPGEIPVYWIVNVPKRQVEVYANPAAGFYPPPAIRTETESVDLVIGGQIVGRIVVADLLPRQS
jgi:Uma2 family endonuclease